MLLQTVANASYNPVEPYVASGWNYMTENYSRFTIAVWFSVVLHEVHKTDNACMHVHELTECVLSVCVCVLFFTYSACMLCAN